MFMDLKSSTTIAENLGHQKYSQLIQNCFYDLTDIVTKYEAQIYQYVGDEVVLSWKYYDKFDFAKCLNTFFSYKEKLEEQKEIYLYKFKCYPEFKAGIHFGETLITEVGDIKREIVYHGDLVNTASRIRSACNKASRKVLISETLLNKLYQSNDFQFEAMGAFKLKGKKDDINLFSVELRENSLSRLC